jgi:hypothetical protein
MVPVGRTLEKKSVQPAGIFIYLNFRIWGLGENMSKITFSTTEINTLKKNPNVHRVSERSICSVLPSFYLLAPFLFFASGRHHFAACF